MAHIIQLPAVLKDDHLSWLFQKLTQADHESEISFDFQQVRFYEPSPIIALITRIIRWNYEGKALLLLNLQSCPAAQYLQRIDFFSILGIQFQENFVRHPNQNRFLEISRIDPRNVDTLARELADCVAQGTSDPAEIKACFSYAIGEMITNVAQHAHGPGFICAQFYPKSQRVHISVGDCGIGLRRSFEGTSLEASLPTAILALEKALEPEVSSALLRPPTNPYGQYVNRGIGLSMLSELTRQTYGNLQILSENALFTRVGDTSAGFQEFPDLSHQGTFVSLSISTEQIDNFNDLIVDVTQVVTPSEVDEWDEMFDINEQ